MFVFKNVIADSAKESELFENGEKIQKLEKRSRFTNKLIFIFGILIVGLIAGYAVFFIDYLNLNLPTLIEKVDTMEKEGGYGGGSLKKGTTASFDEDGNLVLKDATGAVVSTTTPKPVIVEKKQKSVNLETEIPMKLTKAQQNAMLKSDAVKQGLIEACKKKFANLSSDKTDAICDVKNIKFVPASQAKSLNRNLVEEETISRQLENGDGSLETLLEIKNTDLIGPVISKNSIIRDKTSNLNIVPELSHLIENERTISMGKSAKVPLNHRILTELEDVVLSFEFDLSVTGEDVAGIELAMTEVKDSDAITASEVTAGISKSIAEKQREATLAGNTGSSTGSDSENSSENQAYDPILDVGLTRETLEKNTGEPKKGEVKVETVVQTVTIVQEAPPVVNTWTAGIEAVGKRASQLEESAAQTDELIGGILSDTKSMKFELLAADVEIRGEIEDIRAIHEVGLAQTANFTEVIRLDNELELFKQDLRSEVVTNNLLAHSLSAAGQVNLGSSLSVGGFANFGNGFSVSGSKGQFGDSLSVAGSAEFGSTLSLKSFAYFGSTISLYGFGKLGSTVSASGFTNIGSAISVRSFSRFGSDISLYGACKLGSGMSMLDFCTFGSSMSVRSYTRCGSGLSLYGIAKLGSSLSVLDFVHIGSTMSFRSFNTSFLIIMGHAFLILRFFLIPQIFLLLFFEFRIIKLNSCYFRKLVPVYRSLVCSFWVLR